MLLSCRRLKPEELQCSKEKSLERGLLVHGDLGQLLSVILLLLPVGLPPVSYTHLDVYKRQAHSYVALCGTGGQAMHWMLEQNQYLRDVVLCLDNDGPGQAAANRLQTELQEGGYHSGILLPVCKDWNEDLVSGALTASPAMTAVQSL